MSNIIKICEVCDNKKLLTVLDLGEHPLCDDLLEIGSALGVHTGPGALLVGIQKYKEIT